MNKENAANLNRTSDGIAIAPLGRGRLKALFLSRWIRVFAVCALIAPSGFCDNIQNADEDAVGKAESAGKKLVRVITRREGEVTHVLVENRELAEVTMAFNFELENLKSSKELPLVSTFPAGATTEAFILTPVDSAKTWDYSFVNYHNLGSSVAVHDDSFCYSLPYAPGKKYRVSQGYDGKFSHNGSNRFAIDWAMPEGTPVHAARGGLVVRVKDGSTTGGGDLKFDPYNNFILIRHSDGTLGQYCHLQKGIHVREGDVVRDGDLLARSGNTGFSSGPHLHFCVFKGKNGKERESIPVKFRTAGAASITLKAGQKHAAVAVPPRAECATQKASAKTSRAS